MSFNLHHIISPFHENRVYLTYVGHPTNLHTSHTKNQYSNNPSSKVIASEIVVIR